MCESVVENKKNFLCAIPGRVGHNAPDTACPNGGVNEHGRPRNPIGRGFERADSFASKARERSDTMESIVEGVQRSLADEGAARMSKDSWNGALGQFEQMPGGDVQRLEETRRRGRSGCPAADRKPRHTVPQTIWYMGVKSRVLAGFLDRVLLDEIPPGGTVVDLFSGTGVVSAFCARHFRTVSNDVQRYAQILSQGFIEHEPTDRDAFLESLDWRKDLESVYHANRAELSRLYEAALRAEDSHLRRLADFRQAYSRTKSSGRARSKDEQTAIGRYRDFLQLRGSVVGEDRRPATLYRNSRAFLTEDTLSSYRDDPSKLPFCLISAYYLNIYYGIRQAIEIDSLRAAIAHMDPETPYSRRKRIHYLSALLHTASISTSGTSHFAQPRHLEKDSEILAMAQRRQIDVFETFLKFSERIQACVLSTNYTSGNRSFCGDYDSLLQKEGEGEEGLGEGVRFRDEARGDLVYIDPPYTSDNYSRFYHVLEVLTAYDYPELERNREGQVLRGRYPLRKTRFQSAFCKSKSVEGEFRKVIRASAASGSKLVISYGSPNGLLFKTYRKRFPGCDPVKKLTALCEEFYHEALSRRQTIMHSGQGDSNVPTEEILVVCRKPRHRL